MQTLDLPMDELEKFAGDVLERFDNPFVDHQVTSIMLNSFPKFQARDLPGVKTYLERKGELPKGLVFGLAAIITYYKGGKRADGVEIVPNDDQKIMDLLKELWATGDTQKVADGVLGAEFIWQEDLNKIAGLNQMVKLFLDLIQEKAIETGDTSTNVSPAFSLLDRANRLTASLRSVCDPWHSTARAARREGVAARGPRCARPVSVRGRHRSPCASA